MLAIYKRELRSYFSSPIGYIFIGIFLALSGALFSMCTLQLFEESDTAMYFLLMMFALVVIVPLLTMKLFSEERKLKTEQLLLTAPMLRNRIRNLKACNCIGKAFLSHFP